MDIDPGQAILPPSGRADDGPASGNLAKSGPKRVLAFAIDQNPVINLVAFERINQ
jgi:hypothetical protein